MYTSGKVPSLFLLISVKINFQLGRISECAFNECLEITSSFQERRTNEWIPTISHLAKWLAKHLRPLTLYSPTTVRSADHFLTKLKNTTIEPDEIMVSFDVTSLFTSIPKGLAETALRESLSQHRDDSNVSLKKEHLLDVLKLYMQAFFTFQNLPYEQIKGTPMGSVKQKN